MTNDLDVYNACMNFCKLFTRVIADRSQLYQARMLYADEMFVEQMKHNLEIEEGWLIDEFDRLCKVITKFKEGE